MKIKYPYNKPQSPTPINSNSRLFVCFVFFHFRVLQISKIGPIQSGMLK